MAKRRCYVSVTYQRYFYRYIFITTRMIVHTEGIVTQLVFEHALRIRMREDAGPGSAAPSEASTAVATPDSASVHDGDSEAGASTGNGTHEAGSTVGSETVRGSEGSAKGKGKDKSTSRSRSKSTDSKKEKEEPKKEEKKNLTGRINNLITTDLNNIVEGRDFLFLRKLLNGALGG